MSGKLHSLKRWLSIPALSLAWTTMPAAELRWQNNETLPGDLISANAETLTWKSPLFAEPVEIGLHVLRHFKMPPQVGTAAKDPFSIRLNDGSRLYGKITALDDQTLTLESTCHDPLRLMRSSIRCIEHLKADNLLYAGPTSSLNWIGEPKFWHANQRGTLIQAGWNRSSSLQLDIPNKAALKLDLSSTARPEFKLNLISDSGHQLIVETWDDEIVMQGTEFVTLGKLTENDRRVHLRLYWDAEKGRCTALNSRGEKLGEVKTAEPEKPKEAPQNAPVVKGLLGFFQALIAGPRMTGQKTAPEPLALLNKGTNLTLESLSLSAWNGTLPTDQGDDQPHVLLSDASLIQGKAQHADSLGITLQPEKGEAVKLPWNRVQSLTFATAPSEPPKVDQSAECWFRDGTWIIGKLQAVKDQVATLQTSFSTTPIAAKLDQFDRLDLRIPLPTGTELEPVFAKQDKVTSGKMNLHGKLRTNSTPNLRWLAIGAKRETPFAPNLELDITRALPADLKSTGKPTLFYLRSGDVIPGELNSLDKERADITSSLVPAATLPASQLRAIHFGGSQVNLEGFKDPAWQVVRGNSADVIVGPAGLTIKPGASWGHANYLHSDEVKFNFGDQRGFGAMRIRLFCDGLDKSSKSMNLLFGRYSNQVTFGLESTENQMDSQRIISVKSDEKVLVRIAMMEKHVEVFIKGVSVRKIPLSPENCSGTGIILEPFGLWGNSEREVSILNFNSRVVPGRVTSPTVDEQAKLQALMIPRFRQEDPPKHVLLAPNGDLLRGVLEAATAGHLAMRSGLETLQVPRDRVSAAVWLDFEDKKSPTKSAIEQPNTATHWFVLTNGARLALKVDKFTGDHIEGSHDLLGKMKIPMPDAYTLRTKPSASSPAQTAFNNWKVRPAPEPVLPETGGQSSPLLNKEAAAFKLPLLDGGEFDLSKEKGKVIVLDFWATWCGPCIKGMPEMIAAMSDVDAKKVRFIGVNQAESAKLVKKFIETRNWKLTVALDAEQRIGQQFGVEGIPHTVIIDPNGKIAWVKTGYDPQGAKQALEQVKKLLNPAKP